jgi:hypothetical protein
MEVSHAANPLNVASPGKLRYLLKWNRFPQLGGQLSRGAVSA